MSDRTVSVATTKELKRRLLKAAFADENGAEMILRILWVRASAIGRTSMENGLKQLERFERFNKGKPQAMRALATLENMNGNDISYWDTTPQKERAKMLDYLADRLPMLKITRE